MWFTTEMSTFGYLWLFALLRLGCGQDIIFNDYQETGGRTSAPQSSSLSVLPPSRVTATLMDQSCLAPPQPKNGEWRLHPDLCEKNSADCKVPEGTELRLGYQLTYNCSFGYKIKGNDKVYCTANGNWSFIPSCREILCHGLTKQSRAANCSRFGEYVNCWEPVRPNTTAEVSCNPRYKEAGKIPAQIDVAQQPVVKCNDDGNWYPPPIRCVPVVQDCGRYSEQVKDSYGGWDVTKLDQFPWQATLYREERSPRGTIKTFICGATTIKYDFVMTAAHCVYDETVRAMEDAGKLYVMAGNLLRDYDQPENVDGQRSGVRKVYLPFDYYGLRGNYGSDIALLELQEPFDESMNVIPACFTTPRHGGLAPTSRWKGAIGIVAGFGRTKTEESSPTLQAITAPYVPYNECAAPGATADNDVFITKDKFCAGYTNGTVVCDGDSGGGLIFQLDDRWYVLGIVSTSLGVDLNNGEKTCSQHALTLYSKVSEYQDWIETVVSGPQQSEQSRSSMSHSGSSPKISAPLISTVTSSSFHRSRSPAARCSICVSPEQPANGQWKLHPSQCTDLDGSTTSCNPAPGVELEAGTALVYSCNAGYEARGHPEVYCSRLGSWSNIPECVTSNSLIDHRKPLVPGGDPEILGELPWRASFYVEKESPEGTRKEFRCEATIIKANLVLVAKRCVYGRRTNTSLDPKKLFVITGNIHPDYDSPLHDRSVVKRSAVKKLHVHCCYTGLIGNFYASKATLLQLEEPLQFAGTYSRPFSELEGPSEVLRGRDDRPNLFIFRTARGSVVCNNNANGRLVINKNAVWYNLKIASSSDYEK